MAIFWVSTTGDDGDDGSTYELAKATLASALSEVGTTKGHVIRMVNDGNHEMVAAALDIVVGLVGTDMDTDPGLIIEGTDSAGNPALTTVVSTETGTLKRYWVKINGRFIWIRGMVFDYSAGKDDSTSTSITRSPIDLVGGGCGAVRISDCELKLTSTVNSLASTTATTTIIPRMPSNINTSDLATYTGQVIEVTRCVFINSTSLGFMAGATGRVFKHHHNVFIRDIESATAVTMFQWWTGTNVLQSRQLYSNTFVRLHYAADDATACVQSVSNDVANLSLYDNLFYVDCGPASAVKLNAFIAAGSTNSAAGTAAVAFGNNLYVTGPNIGDVSAWASANTRGYGSYQMNAGYRSGTAWVSCNGASIDATSAALASTDFADTFHNTGAYTWSPDVYDHVLPFDLRPSVGRTMSSTGGVVGAIDDAIVVDVPPVTEDPVSVVGRNYLDSYPFYKPLIKADATAMVRIRRNKEYSHVDLRHYLRDHVHDESTQRVTQLAAGATFVCGFGGVYRAQGVLLVTDQELSVTVTHFNGTTNSTFTVTVDQLLMLDGCEVTQLEFTNNSTSTACVQVVAFD